ncbi:MAG: metallophosphoesterase family protein [Solirubrobacteraceae bacterium]
MQIAVISDTHMPKGGRRLADECVARLRSSDLIIHAGDLIGLEVLNDLRRYAPVKAVHGNVDDAAVKTALPEVATVSAEGVRIEIVHDSGPARGRLARLRSRFPDADAVVFGHSHMPLHERGEDGFQIFNPGSPTERRRAPSRTMGIARANAGKLTFELVTLG